MRFDRFILLSVVALGAFGCAAELGDDEAPVGEAHLAGFGGGDPSPGGKNGKRPTCFWDRGTQNAYRALGQKGLEAFPTLTGILPGCRDEVIRNVVECALSTEQTVTDPVTGTSYSGWWGLAPKWLSAPLDRDGRRWVTACMAQRLNYFGTQVPILLEGANEAIHTVPELETRYPFGESYAWGDIFSSDRDSTGQIYVCWEDSLEQACGPRSGPLVRSRLSSRICDRSSACGLHVMGRCSDVCVQDEDGYIACQRPDGTLDNHTVHVQLKAKNLCDLPQLTPAHGP
jgi:hypothetical protein